MVREWLNGLRIAHKKYVLRVLLSKGASISHPQVVAVYCELLSLTPVADVNYNRVNKLEINTSVRSLDHLATALMESLRSLKDSGRIASNARHYYTDVTEVNAATWLQTESGGAGDARGLVDLVVLRLTLIYQQIKKNNEVSMHSYAYRQMTSLAECNRALLDLLERMNEP